MNAPAIIHVRTRDPNGVAIATMGNTARRAADTWTIREWASRLATRAPPRDYVRQLEALYNGIIDRWRYVQEHGEWVPGSPRALLAYTLGAAYNYDPRTCPSPERCDVERTAWREFGFGDCDDVATLAAAGALAIGCTPYFRTAKGAGGAHISVTARTPRGDLVDLDPVGHPDKGFGWAVDGPGILVEHWDLDGRPVALAGAATMGAAYNLQPLEYGGFGYAHDLGECPSAGPGTYMVGVDEFQQLPRQHLALVHPHDTRGPRVLAIPEWSARVFRRGAAWHGTPAADQFGDPWAYDADQDLWVPAATWQRSNPMGAWGGTDFGRRRFRFFRRIGRFFRRIGRGVKRVAKAVVRGARRVVGRILSSKLAQAILSRVLVAVGVPPPATRALMAASGSILRRGGLIQLIRLARKSPKAALKFLAKAVAEAGKAAMLPKLGIKLSGFSGDDGIADAANDQTYHVQTSYGSYYAVPVAALAGCPGVYEFGQLEVSDVPVPGRWYRIRKGDSLLKVAGKAYGLGAGGERLERSKWINEVPANAVYFRKTDAGFERNVYGPNIISFSPKFACETDDAIAGGKGSCFAPIYIPIAKGDEPPKEPEEPPPAPECPEGSVWDDVAQTCKPLVVVPEEPEEPEEPPTPEPPPPPILPPETPVQPKDLPPVIEEPEEPVTPAPPVEPKGPAPEEPPTPEPPIEPEEPTPVEEECPQGFIRRTPGGPCEMIVPMCREPMVWDDAQKRCVLPVAPEEPEAPEEPPPFQPPPTQPPVQPRGPSQPPPVFPPFQPAPAGKFPWMLALAIFAEVM